MCTAVVGGSIQRAATSISAASNQSTTAPMSSQRIDDRRNPARTGGLASVFGMFGVVVFGIVGSVSGMAVTLQNNILRRVAAAGRSCAPTQGARGELGPLWRLPRFEPKIQMEPQAVGVRHQEER